MSSTPSMNPVNHPSHQHPYRHLEQRLPDDVRDLYHNLIGTMPDSVTCKFLGHDQLAVVFENSITPVEKLLYHHGFEQFTQQVRREIDLIFQKHLANLLETSLQRRPVEFLSESKLSSGRKSIIVIFESAAHA